MSDFPPPASLTLEGAKSKVADSWALARAMYRAADAQEFRVLFLSAVAAARAVPDAINREALRTLKTDQRLHRHGPMADETRKRLARYVQWEQARTKQRRRDALLQFVESARDEDLHEGKHGFLAQSSMTGGKIKVPPSYPPGTAVVLGPEGAFLLVDQGTSRERIVPWQPDLQIALQISILDPPRSHLGTELPELDPARIAILAIDYYAELLFDARQQFAEPRLPDGSA